MDLRSLFLLLMCFFLSPLYSAQQSNVYEKSRRESLYLSEIVDAGNYVILNDNSVWKVNPEDVPIAAGWIAAGRIIIKKSGNSLYPYRFHNKQTDDDITVRKSSLAEIKEFEKQSEQAAPSK